MSGWQDAPEETASQSSPGAWAAAPLETVAAIPDAPPVAPAADPTTSDRVQAFESGVWRGASYLPTIPLDAAANVFNLARAGLGYGYSKVTGQVPPSALQVNQEPSPFGAGLASWLDRFHNLTPTTMDTPQDPASRYLSVAGSVIPGAAVGGGSVGGAARAYAGGLPAAISGQVVSEARPFESDWANTAASGLTQLGVGYGMPLVTKAMIRGFSPDELNQNVEAFREAGAEPSLGQASGTRRMQFLESMLSKIPGGAGVFSKFAGQQASDLGSAAEGTVSSLSENVGPEAAGEAITQGVKGEGGAVDQFRQQSSTLFKKVDQYVPQDSKVSVSNALETLDNLTQPIAGAESVSATLTNPKIASIRDAIVNDVGAGDSLPYAALSRVRSQVGDLIGGNELISGIPRGQLKQLYGALSDDMGVAVQNAGPQAANAWQQAQSFYRTGIDRMDQLDSLVNRQGGPEAIFRSAMSGSDYGGSRLRTILGSIAPDQRNTVAATVLDRMGRAPAGNQNAAGDVYSPQTFLTNWNRMSDEAKTALFGDEGTTAREHLENTAGVAQNIKEGSKVFANASGTAGGMNQSELFKNGVTLGMGALLGGAGGAAGAAGGLIGVPASAYALSKGMISPVSLNWAGRPAFGSGAQLGAFNAAPGNLDEFRRRLALGLEPMK